MRSERFLAVPCTFFYSIVIIRVSLLHWLCVSVCVRCAIAASLLSQPLLTKDAIIPHLSLFSLFKIDSQENRETYTHAEGWNGFIATPFVKCLDILLDDETFDNQVVQPRIGKCISYTRIIEMPSFSTKRLLNATAMMLCN